MKAKRNMNYRRVQLLLGCAACVSVGAAFGITSGGADSPTSSRVAAAHASTASKEMLNRVVASSNGLLHGASHVVSTDAGVVSYGRVVGGTGDGTAASSSICFAFAPHV